MTVTLALFTRDLRVHDNPVLMAACNNSAEVVPLFVLDDKVLSGRYNTANKAHFLAAALRELDDELRSLGGRLVVRRGRTPEVVERIVEELSITEVHLASDVSAYSRRRERQIRQRLAAQGCSLNVHAATVTVIEPGDLIPLAGHDHFAVFTPYYRKWRNAAIRAVLSPPPFLKVADLQSDPLPTPAELCPQPPSAQLTVGGETTGRRMLKRWVEGHADWYHENRDDMAADSTSRLSPYLHFGCLSPVEVVQSARPFTGGREAFVRQIACRDFYHQVLAARPDAARADYRGGRRDGWHVDPDLFDAWREGRTGYPIVDAGMRQLAAEGWMHNRARLMTASFLVKTLGLDWRLGADHFMSLLMDGDVANNQLNWQWIAGTGTDTRPYRVLNPVRQAERYDPHGNYVRRWVPELAHIRGGAVHKPWELGARAAPDYPRRIVDHLDATLDARSRRPGHDVTPARDLSNRPRA